MRSICQGGAARRVLLVAATLGGSASGAFADVIPLLPTATYLRTNSDWPTSALIIPLAGRAINEGSLLDISICGDFKPGNNFTDSYVSAVAVFSSTNTLLASDQPHRVPGALPAGIDFPTTGTLYGNFATDIPEDFLIGLTPESRTVTVVVPAGAQYLFVSTLDSYMGDNSDPDHDWSVSLSVVPEPGTASLMAAAGLLLARRRRS